MCSKTVPHQTSIATHHRGEFTLSVDIGGSGIKGMVLDAAGEPVSERVRIKTPRPAEPQAVIDTVCAVAQSQPGFDRVAAGFPGVVTSGVVKTAPNLDGAWTDVPLAKALAQALGRPCRVANDADVQGYAVIEGIGVEMVLTLGTGLGAALFTSGHLAPNLELGHHPFKSSQSYEDYVGEAARLEVGNERWSERVTEVITQVLPIWNPRIVYVGGGNSKHLANGLPAGVQIVPNVAGILGGFHLWRDQPV